MLNLPSGLRTEFETCLRNAAIPKPAHAAYTKWLRYDLDFCQTYHFPHAQKESLPRFLHHWQEKKQTKAQQQQASHAVSLYDERMRFRDSHSDVPSLKKDNPPGKAPDQPSLKTVSSSNDANTSTGVSWIAVYTRLANDIQVRHYAPNTLKAYTPWVRHVPTLTRSKDPESLSSADVREFLTCLAVDRKVSASTQHQAFNARWFLYRHVLNQAFGTVEGVVRAKRTPDVPVVWSRAEIETILQYLPPPYDLVVKLLYGCGRRLSECVQLRVHGLNVDAGVFTIHDGKGGKDRTVPLPETILPELRAPLESLKDLHQRDLERHYAGVFLVHALEKKYTHAAKELIWQWLFPAKQLTYLQKTEEYRRYHVHETPLHKAIQEAVGKARIDKRASAHTFRHSLASHLLQANDDIRTI